jgi:adenylyl cyclase-associated protein
LISRCNKTTIQIKGKFNAVSVDNSTKLSLVVDSLVSSIDVIKSPSFAVQVLGTLPTLLMDQVDGGTIYLSRESLGTEIFTSKCTAININVPGQTDDDDYAERAVPEQFKSTIGKNGALITEIVEHAG